ncbi:hypothetical protein GGTG_04710 [Gaeumannomyces tritici R3-111a-1]|uniref:Uncharacterized protein n=1 Tax=Gaeumannomyces tritici (strain R3-111a-1) TaxID=644352 RepID=J3NTW1_GAET3|nr:hypothetical protein GGTG_04710 [Gaeumannomyces tritici R3-111a-1]EJT79626.1 hypothetical protein GGTG_04710 [Gaeumannomyces tritici R3-111a-1]
MIEDNDDDIQSSLYWRQAFDVRTAELSDVPTQKAAAEVASLGLPDTRCAYQGLREAGQDQATITPPTLKDEKDGDEGKTKPHTTPPTLKDEKDGDCGKWLHSDCLIHDALARVYEKLGKTKPHITPPTLKDEKDGDEAKTEPHITPPTLKDEKGFIALYLLSFSSPLLSPNLLHKIPSDAAAEIMSGKQVDSSLLGQIFTNPYSAGALEMARANKMVGFALLTATRPKTLKDEKDGDEAKSPLSPKESAWAMPVGLQDGHAPGVDAAARHGLQMPKTLRFEATPRFWDRMRMPGWNDGGPGDHEMFPAQEAAGGCSLLDFCLLMGGVDSQTPEPKMCWALNLPFIAAIAGLEHDVRGNKKLVAQGQTPEPEMCPALNLPSLPPLPAWSMTSGATKSWWRRARHRSQRCAGP